MSEVKMSTEAREAEVNARETLHFMTVMNHKNIQILSDIARGVPVEKYSDYLKKIYKLRLMFDDL